MEWKYNSKEYKKNFIKISLQLDIFDEVCFLKVRAILSINLLRSNKNLVNRNNKVYNQEIKCGSVY